jgi:hypothetical protein
MKREITRVRLEVKTPKGTIVMINTYMDMDGVAKKKEGKQKAK